jgi:hypothetical protein
MRTAYRHLATSGATTATNATASRAASHFAAVASISLAIAQGTTAYAAAIMLCG